MGKICRFCGAENGEERIFCSECGEALDQDLKFRMEAEKYEKNLRSGNQGSGHPRRPSDREDDAPLPPLKQNEAKTSWLPVALAFFAAAILALYLLFR